MQVIVIKLDVEWKIFSRGLLCIVKNKNIKIKLLQLHHISVTPNSILLKQDKRVKLNKKPCIANRIGKTLLLAIQNTVIPNTISLGVGKALCLNA